MTSRALQSEALIKETTIAIGTRGERMHQTTRVLCDCHDTARPLKATGRWVADIGSDGLPCGAIVTAACQVELRSGTTATTVGSTEDQQIAGLIVLDRPRFAGRPFVADDGRSGQGTECVMRQRPGAR